MKKIGFINTPLSSGHAIRGVGFYTRNLLNQMSKLAPEYGIQIVETASPEGEFDLIHYPFFDLFYPTLPLFKSTPTVVTIHDVIPLEYPSHYPPGIKGLLNLIHQKLSLNSVDRVITDSYASVMGIRSNLHVPNHKIKLVYLAADEVYQPVKDKKQLLRVKNKFNLPDKFVLYVGDINWNKNILSLVTACEKAHEKLVIVGKQAATIDSMDLSHPELRHLVEFKLHISTNVIRLGFVSTEDLVSIYNLATVYCQPSFAEGFGLPILEAMSCGTPVVCSNTSSLPEIGGDAVLYFSPDSVDEIAGAISRVKSSPEKSLEQAAKFSWEKAAIQTLLVYKEIL
jgi:glycosyltransferase involved in cell wall biosynthesis